MTSAIITALILLNLGTALFLWARTVERNAYKQAYEFWQKRSDYWWEFGSRHLELMGIAAKQAVLWEERAGELEKERQRLRGLIHAEQLADMHYCETCELGFQGPDDCCPHCEREEARKELRELKERQGVAAG